MDLNILERYISLCDVLSVRPSWKGLNEYYRHNKLANRFKRKICFAQVIDYRYHSN